MVSKSKTDTISNGQFKTHDVSAFYESFESAETKILWDRFELYLPPNMAVGAKYGRIELHVLNGQCLNRLICMMKKINEEVDGWQTHRNNKNKKTNCQFTTTKQG